MAKVQLNLVDMRITTVMDKRIFEHRKHAFGVERGSKVKAELGMSLRSDVYFYKDRKVELRADLYSFFNTKTLILDLRGNLTYCLNKFMKISVILEVYRDKDFADFTQFRQEILTGFTFRR